MKKVFVVKVYKYKYNLISESGVIIFSFYAKNEKEAEYIAKNYMSSFGNIAIVEVK